MKAVLGCALVSICLLGPAAGQLTAADPPPKDTALVVSGMEDLSPWELLTFTCLQGIANRDRPAIYLMIDGKNDQLWLDWYKKQYGLKTQELAGPYDLFRYQWPLGGFCLTDPEAKHTGNLAANYASAEDLLPVTRKMLDTHPELPKLAIRRDLTQEFRALTVDEVYAWAYEHQWRPLNYNRAIVANTMAPDRKLSPFYQAQHIRDFAVARGGFMFELSANPQHDAEYAVRDKYLADMSDWGYLLGWHVERDSEPQHVEHATKHHQLVLCSNTSPNFSFHQHVRPEHPAYVQKHLLRRGDKVALEQDKVYLTFYFSDGDSLNWLCRGAHGGRWLNRGKIPMGWEMQPLLLDVAPGMLDYFYQTATEKDVLIASASGIGYNHPERFSADRLRQYLRMSKDYYRKLDLNALIVLLGPKIREEGLTRATTGIYGDLLGDTLLGVFESYTSLKSDSHMVDGMAWMPTRLPHSTRRKPEPAYQDFVKMVRENPGRPLFVPFHVNKGHMSYNDAVEFVAKAEQEFPGQICVTTPDEILLLYHAWASGSRDQ